MQTYRLGEKMKKCLVFIFILIGLSAFGKPFWTEKSVYVEDGKVYAVGISSSSFSQEEKRIEALKNAKKEIVISLGLPSDLQFKLNTKMTFEDKRRTYRLSWIHKTHLDTLIKVNLHEKEKKLSQSQKEEIRDTVNSIFKKSDKNIYGSITSRSKSYDEKFKDYSTGLYHYMGLLKTKAITPLALLKLGNGHEKLGNTLEAVKIYQATCFHKYSNGCFEGARYFIQQSRDGEDIRTALYFQIQGCNLGDKSLCNLYAQSMEMYHQKIGGKHFIVAALEYYKKACALKDSRSCDSQKRLEARGIDSSN